MKAMLFAAGLGTRLKPFTDKYPKALAQVNDKTLLQINIEYLQKFGVKDVVVNVHHFADQIEAILKENNGFGSRVQISDERTAVLETGGGLLNAAQFFENEEEFIIMNVDVLTNLNLLKLIESHNVNSLATLAVMNRTSSRYLLFNQKSALCGWKNNTTGEEKIVKSEINYQALAFSGIQIFSNKLLKSIPFTGKFSLIDVYLNAAQTGTVMGFDHSGDVFIDVGKPESLKFAETLF